MIEKIASSLLEWGQLLNLGDIRRYLETHPELLTEEALVIMGMLVEQAKENNDQQAIRVFEDNLELLRECRELGVELAFAKRFDSKTSKMPAELQALLEQLSPEHREKFLELNKQASTAEEFRNLLYGELELMAALEKILGQDSSSGVEIPLEFQADHLRAEQLQKEYQQTGNPEALTQAIEIWLEVLDSSIYQRSEQEFQFAVMAQIGSILLQRYWELGKVIDLSQAIAFTQQAVTGTEDSHPNKADYLNRLGMILWARYTRGDGVADLEQAIEVTEKALGLTLAGSPDKLMFLNNLGLLLSERYEQIGELEDLERAIEVAEEVVGLTEDGNLNKADYLTNLGTILSVRFKQIGKLEDLERALDASEKAVYLTEDGNPNKATYLNNLGGMFSVRYERIGKLGDLERAIEIAEEVVGLTKDGNPAKAGYLHNLANWLSDRYEQIGELGDLERAIEMTERAVKMTPAGSPEKAKYLNSQGTILSARYKRSGKLEDLEQALDALEKAVYLTQDSNSEKSMYLTNLGVIFSYRYKRTGELADLERAIEVAEEAKELIKDDNPGKAGYLNNLANRLLERYGRSGELADLDRAIEMTEKAVRLTEEGSPKQTKYLNNLGVMLSIRYERIGELADLERANEIAEEVVDLTEDSHPNKAGYLNNLGRVLSSRYRLTENLSDLHRAIVVMEKAVRLTSMSSPDKAMRQNNLGDQLSNRYRWSRELGDLEQAIKIYQQAIEIGQIRNPQAVIYASRSWGRLMLGEGEWQQVYDVLEHAQSTIRTLVKQHALRSAKEDWLKEVQGIADQQAFALGKMGQVDEAVEVIEKGRGQLLSAQLVHKRANLSALEAEAPDLAERYLEITGLIKFYQQADLEGTKEREHVRANLRQFNQDLEELVEEIKDVPGFEDFLAELEIGGIRVAAADFPIVYMAVTVAGTLVLVVEPSGEVPYWFVDMNEDELRERMQGPLVDSRLGGYLGIYQDWKRKSQRGVPKLVYQDAEKAWFDALENISEWLWDELVGTLVEKLQAAGYDNARLIPGGLLSFLPLHAAWVEDASKPTGKRYALDEIHFSYVPNAQALRSAKGGKDRPVDSLLMIDNPDGSLMFSHVEADAVTEYFREKQVKHLANQDATFDEISNNLTKFSVLHFSTHGMANFNQPLDSGIQTADPAGSEQMLRLRDVIGMDLSKARLAVLSACETGIPGTRLIDEVVSLPTGWLQAGVPGVVSSLWAVQDASTMMLMERFYRFWRAEEMSPAEALRKAQQWVRDTTNRQKEEHYGSWVNQMSEGTRMSADAAREMLNTLLIKGPDEHSFEHPFFWAAFGYFGV